MCLSIIVALPLGTQKQKLNDNTGEHPCSNIKYILIGEVKILDK